MRLSSLATLGVAMILGCDSSVSPERPTAVFALQTLDGAPPPVRPTPVSVVTVHAETLFFDPGGTGRARITMRRDSDGLLTANESPFTWSREGAVLSVWPICLGNGVVPCPATPGLRGVVAGDAWLIEDYRYYALPAVFKRVD